MGSLQMVRARNVRVTSSAYAATYHWSRTIGMLGAATSGLLHSRPPRCGASPLRFGEVRARRQGRFSLSGRGGEVAEGAGAAARGHPHSGDERGGVGGGGDDERERGDDVARGVADRRGDGDGVIRDRSEE